MLLTQKKTLFAFCLPFVFLIGMWGMNEYYLKTSQTFVLPIEGYDPRDLIAGHYLIYKVDYGLKCPAFKSKKKSTLVAYICVKPERKITLLKKPKNCTLFIKGRCNSRGDFYRNLIYYIPEKRAEELEKLFMSAKNRKVVFSITKKGHPLVKDLLIDDKPLRSIIQNP